MADPPSPPDGRPHHGPVFCRSRLLYRAQDDRCRAGKEAAMNSVRKMLAQYEILPRKRLGQSFLSDMNLTRKIVALVEPAGDETIVEIGAGLGFMTEELARKAGKVIALETDTRLSAALR